MNFLSFVAIMLNLSKKELADLNRGLIVAMKKLDDSGRHADKLRSDRLEIIQQKLNK